jgi:hypothetical protein
MPVSVLILVPFLIMYGLYAAAVGILILSFPESKLSRYHICMSFKTLDVSNYGARKLIMGMAVLGVGFLFWNSAGKGSSDSLTLFASVFVSFVVFAFLFLFNLLTAYRANFSPPSELVKSTLLYEPWTTFIGCENSKIKEPRSNGKLVLTGEKLCFLSSKTKRELSILISTIQWVRIVPFHGKWARTCPVLQVAYAGENQPLQVAGFAIGSASEWVETIEWVASDIGHKIEVVSRKLEKKEIQHFRLERYIAVLTALFLAALIAYFFHFKN